MRYKRMKLSQHTISGETRITMGLYAHCAKFLYCYWPTLIVFRFGRWKRKDYFANLTVCRFITAGNVVRKSFVRSV